MDVKISLFRSITPELWALEHPIGGTNNNGTIFSINENGTGYTVLADFNGTKGANPIDKTSPLALMEPCYTASPRAVA